MTNLLFTLLDAQPQTAGQGGQEQSMLPTIIMLVVLFAIVYFFMIRPQSKQRKEMQKFRDSLHVGQDVVTIGGMHGTIRSISETDNTVVIEVATGTKITFEKSAISPTGKAAGQR